MARSARAQKALGPWMTTALVVGNMIGSGVFLLPAALSPFGGISLVGWAFTAGGSLLLALVFARLGRIFPKVGGPYAYTREGFGDVVGFQVAWKYWIAIWAGNAAIAVAFVGYLGEFVPELTDNLSAVAAVLAIWLLTWINAIGVRPAGWLQSVTTIAKIVPLLADVGHSAHVGRTSCLCLDAVAYARATHRHDIRSRVNSP